MKKIRQEMRDGQLGEADYVSGRPEAWVVGPVGESPLGEGPVSSSGGKLAAQPGRPLPRSFPLAPGPQPPKLAGIWR